MPLQQPPHQPEQVVATVDADEEIQESPMKLQKGVKEEGAAAEVRISRGAKA